MASVLAVAMLPTVRAADLCRPLERPHRFEQLSMAKGLPHNVVFAIEQDRHGFIWLATKEGLGRFDGFRFKVWRNDPMDPDSLADDDISSLVEDRHGRWWLGTWGGGLDRLDPATGEVRHFTAGPGDGETLHDNRIQCLLERGGAIWVGTFQGGLSRIDADTERITTFRNDPGDPESLPGDRVWWLESAGDGQLWVATGSGLARLDIETSTFETFRHDPGDDATLSHDIVRTLLTDSRGLLWVGTERGVNHYSPGAGRFVRVSDQAGTGLLASSTINVIAEDRAGRLWIGTNDSGLLLYDPSTGSLQSLRHDPQDPDSLANDDVRDVMVDRSDVLWVGTRGGGVSVLDLKPARFHRAVPDDSDPGSLPDPRVQALAEDHDGRLWVGTAAGLSRCDGSSFTHFVHDPSDPDSIPQGDVLDVLVDSNRAIWVVTWRTGVSVLEPGTRHFRHLSRHRGGPDRGPISDLAGVLFEDAGGTVWVGTRYGLSAWRRETETFRHYRPDADDPQALSDGYVRALADGPDGSVWVGTDAAGLYLLDPGTATVTGFDSLAGRHTPLATGRILCLLPQPAEERLWVGTPNGLYRVETSGWEVARFTEDDGLVNAHVAALLEDDEGALWISTNAGLSRLDAATMSFQSYISSDALEGQVFIPNAALKTSDGRFLFGGMSGCTLFVPSAVQSNPYPPEVVVTEVLSSGQPMQLGGETYRADEVVLGWQDTVVTFEFAALEFTNPEQNRYRYRLDPIDRDWIDAGNRQSASYTHLPPGEYTFRVTASNNDGIWSPDGARLGVVMPPAWWQTVWFRGLMVGLLVLVGVASYSLRMRAVRRRQRQLERLVAERTHALARKQEQLAQINAMVQAINTAHELDDVLSAILAEARAIHGVDRAVALVFDDEDATFRCRARFGWSDGAIDATELSEEAAAGALIAPAEEIYEDIFVIKNLSAAALGVGPAVASMLVMRVQVDGKVAGYLVFDSLRDPDAFDHHDLLLLRGLKEHIVSAFRKAAMLNQLRELNEKKNEFLGIAAHDLRSPLGIISSWVWIAIRSLESGRRDVAGVVGHLRKVVSVSEHLAELVAEVLDISAIESGKLTLQRTSQQLGPILRECETLHRAIADDKEIDLAVDSDVQLPDVVADRMRILEVLDNLVSNAIKYTHPGGSVRVHAEASNGEVVIHVSDTGQGLSEDDLKRVFRSYTKLSPRPTAGERSTGLGLAIVKKIVELHGGRVWVSSLQGEGSRFSFALPRAPE